MNAEQREIFRNSNTWKSFRESLIETQKIDPVTLEPLEWNANCHHLRLSHDKYTDLSDRNAFVMLNKKTHEKIHEIYNTGNWKSIMENIPTSAYKDRFIKILELMDGWNNSDKTELFLFSNHIDYSFDESNKPLVAYYVKQYNMPYANLYGNPYMILWNPNTKEAPNDMPVDTKEYLKYIVNRNNKLELIDYLRIAELRHLGLYSSYKNIHKKDTTKEWVKNIITMLEKEIINTTDMVHKIQREREREV